MCRSAESRAERAEQREQRAAPAAKRPMKTHLQRVEPDPADGFVLGGAEVHHHRVVAGVRGARVAVDVGRPLAARGLRGRGDSLTPARAQRSSGHSSNRNGHPGRDLGCLLRNHSVLLLLSSSGLGCLLRRCICPFCLIVIVSLCCFQLGFY